MKKLAIICQFTYPSACGVWASIENMIPFLKKNYEIHVFSSNEVKGTNKVSSNYETIEGITFHRFPIKFKISENATFWDFEKDLLRLKPDVIHTHVYRHPHSTKALKIAQKLKVPCFLTTHAPFLENNQRKTYLNLLVKFYDFFIGRKLLNKYTKVIAITNWELPTLKEIGCLQDKIIIIPNGVSEEFFHVKIYKHPIKNIIYMGRVAPVKNLELVNRLAYDFPQLNFFIVGPVEKGYNFANNLNNLKLINKKYDKKEEINYMNKSDVFILPSFREANPLVLMEAMAAGKIVISSNTLGGKELLSENNGFIFNSYNDLKSKFVCCINNHNKLLNIRKNARKFAKQRTWKRLSEQLIN